MKTYWAILFTGLVFLAGESSAQQELPKSKPLLERRVADLADEARQKEAAKAELALFSGKVKLAQQCIDQSQPPAEDEIKNASNRLRKAWDAVVKAKDSTIIDKGHPEFDELERSYDSFSAMANSFSSKCLQDLGGNRRPSFLSEDDNKPISIVDQLLTQHMPQQRRNTSLMTSGHLRIFIFRYLNEGDIRSKIPKTEIDLISKNIETEINSFENQDQAKATIKNNLQQLAGAIERESNTIRTRIEEIDKQMAELDTKLSVGTAATDKQLIVAVYLMIGALLVLFLSIKFLDKDLALKVIENRSLVEVVSMAFLLLTIIILGTGGKMPSEAIGTLLGSIAGYIFGRKMSEGK